MGNLETIGSRLPVARDVVKRRLVTVSADQSLEEGVRTLLRAGFSGAPVIDAQGRLVGMLSEFDCLGALAEAVAEDWPAGRVSDHMTIEIDTVEPSENVLSLVSRFRDGRHRRLLVVESDRPVGIITRRDLMASLSSLEEALTHRRAGTTYEILERRRAAPE